MGALTKCITTLQKPIKTFFSSILPKAMLAIILVICVVCKHYRRASFRYKYASIIKHKSCKFDRRRKPSGVMDSSECVVCLSEIGDGEEATELKCGHVFHRECLDRWLRCDVAAAATCPLCRRVVLPPNMVAEYLMARDGKEDNGIEMDLALFLLSTLDHRRCNEFS